MTDCECRCFHLIAPYSQLTDELHCYFLYVLSFCLCLPNTHHTHTPTHFYPVSLLTASVYPEYQWCRLQIDRAVCHMTLYVLGLYPRMTAGRHTHTHARIRTLRYPQHGTLYLTEAWQWGKHRRTYSGKLMGMHTLNHRRGVSQAERERERKRALPLFTHSCSPSYCPAGKVEKHWISPFPPAPSISNMHACLPVGRHPTNVSHTNTFVTDKPPHSQWVSCGTKNSSLMEKMSPHFSPIK